jgi:hypothetical protein
VHLGSAKATSANEAAGVIFSATAIPRGFAGGIPLAITANTPLARVVIVHRRKID